MQAVAAPRSPLASNPFHSAPPRNNASFDKIGAEQLLSWVVGGCRWRRWRTMGVVLLFITRQNHTQPRPPGAAPFSAHGACRLVVMWCCFGGGCGGGRGGGYLQRRGGGGAEARCTVKKLACTLAADQSLAGSHVDGQNQPETGGDSAAAAAAKRRRGGGVVWRLASRSLLSVGRIPRMTCTYYAVGLLLR